MLDDMEFIYHRTSIISMITFIQFFFEAIIFLMIKICKARGGIHLDLVSQLLYIS